MMDITANSKKLIENFIGERVAKHGLDCRTEKAYRLDLELFYIWLGQKEAETSVEKVETDGWGACAEDYLTYLTMEKKLSSSTISRKNRVISYYLSYLARQGLISGYHPPIRALKNRKTQNKKEGGQLSRKDADAFLKP